MMDNLFSGEISLFCSRIPDKYLTGDENAFRNSLVDADENPDEYVSSFVNPLWDKSDVIIPLEIDINLISHKSKE